MGAEGAQRGVFSISAATGERARICVAQLEVSVADALVRLRVSSFAVERPLAAVAADVVGRRLRLDENAR